MPMLMYRKKLTLRGRTRYTNVFDRQKFHNGEHLLINLLVAWRVCGCHEKA